MRSEPKPTKARPWGPRTAHTKREWRLGQPSPGGRESIDLATKLNKLFDVVHKASEPPLSNAAAARGITAKTAVPILATDLQQMRDGTKANPTAVELQAIAMFFGVTPSYLINPGIDAEIDDQLNLLQAIRDSGVRDISACASISTPEGLKTMIEHVVRGSDRAGSAGRTDRRA